MTSEASVHKGVLRGNVLCDLDSAGATVDIVDYGHCLMELKEEQALVILGDKVIPTQYGINLYN